MQVEHNLPSVSILMFVRNGSKCVERAVDSVLNQNYQNIEFIIQDGASDDGTREFLEAIDDPRVKLISEPDQGAADGFARALRRCSGEIVGSCLSDEELVPNAIVEAVAFFKDHPGVVAMYGDAQAKDLSGDTIRRVDGVEFDLIEYLEGRQTPYFCASFFRRSALLESGIRINGPFNPCLEFEIWLCLAAYGQIAYRPGILARYAWHDDQLSNKAGAILEHVDARMAFIDLMFSDEGFFGQNPELRDYFKISQGEMFSLHLAGRGERQAQKRCKDLTANIRAQAGAGFLNARSRKENLSRAWTRLAYATPMWLHELLNRGTKDVVRRIFFGVGRIFTHSNQDHGNGTTVMDPAAKARLGIYKDLALIYEGRGQVELACKYFQKTEVLNDRDIASLYCQTLLKNPDISDQDQAQAQAAWVARFISSEIKSKSQLLPHEGKQIRVGYVGSVWNSPYMRYQVLSFIRHHDRSKFRIYSYAGMKEGDDISRCFDVFRWVGNLDDQAFGEQVTDDGIDILVELNGFSPGHRFAAMARRLASVQVSYVNHNATSGVPNIDYVIADDIAAPAGVERSYSEKILRLPGCFFCFDYTDSDAPDVADCPSEKTGTVTFGYMGSLSRVDDATIGLWASVLRVLPESRLIMRNHGLSSNDTRHYIQSRFTHFGVSAERLILKPGGPRQDVLRDYGDIDIAFDTQHYCGGNTIAEALWQGVPVITLKGDQFVSAYGASLLVASGCGDLVSETPDDFVVRSVALAQSPERRADLRKNLRDMMHKSGFSDSKKFAAKVEDAYCGLLDGVLKTVFF